MKKIKYFYLKSCPYCKQANGFLEELLARNPEYKALEIERIEEKEQANLASKYDYYYVPTFYVDDVKKHEGAATLEKIKAVLDAAL